METPRTTRPGLSLGTGVDSVGAVLPESRGQLRLQPTPGLPSEFSARKAEGVGDTWHLKQKLNCGAVLPLTSFSLQSAPWECGTCSVEGGTHGLFLQAKKGRIL